MEWFISSVFSNIKMKEVLDPKLLRSEMLEEVGSPDSILVLILSPSPSSAKFRRVILKTYLESGLDDSRVEFFHPTMFKKNV